ncbi:glycosyltransferase family 2 protein [Candidatus Kaiserbacteria bacterium]|nr:glycosyltransferase family 2 protein [Candidatus Kaiserbacteria bacterium]
MTEGGKDVDLTLVILCYKGGERVREFVQQAKQCLDSRNLTYRLVLVGNYNADEKESDATPGIVRDIASREERIIAVTLEKKGMFGWDVKTGLKEAEGRTIAFIDGDGQNPIQDVVRVYDALMEDASDMALTYRVKRHDGLERILISRIYNTLLRVLFPRVTIYDANAKPKIFTRNALSLLTLEADDWFIDAEMVIQACYKNFRVAQVPSVFLKQKGRSSFVNVRAIVAFLFALIMYRVGFRI